MKKAFILCGLTGWCMEILWTGLHSILSGELTMTGKTSLLMFPIYGCGAIIRPLSGKLSACPAFCPRLHLYCRIFLRWNLFSGALLRLFSYVSLGLQQHSSELPGTDKTRLRSPSGSEPDFFLKKILGKLS